MKEKSWIIQVVDLYRAFSLGNQKIEVLKGINLEVEEGEMLGIVGASGAGKSTLLHLMGALDRPNRGKIFFDGIDLFSLDDKSLADFRNRKIGFIFQFHHLLPEFTALENTMLPALIRRVSKHKARERAIKILTEMGLEQRLHNKPGELSGGEQQRVAVARAIMNDPDIILADEPTGNLDQKTGESVYQLLRKLNREKSKTLVIVTHSQEIALKLDRVLKLVDGSILNS
jgi:lipoprotein-releasing system ATP-binding protein